MPKIFVWQGRLQGGAEHITLNAARWLASHGANVTIGVFAHQPNLPLHQIVLTPPSWVPDSFKSLYASLLWRHAHARTFDAVYSHTLGWWKTSSNQIFIHDAADLDAYLHAAPTPLHRLAAWCWKKLYIHLCLRSASAILSASDDFSAFCQRHGVPPQKIHKSGSFFDEKLFRFQHRQPPQPPYRVLWIGNYTDPRKQFIHACRALHNNPLFEVHIVGGPDAPRENNFHYHGQQPLSSVAALLNQSHVYLHTARREGFSLALLEALATGIPCLVYEQAVNPELQSCRNLRSYRAFNNITQHLLKTINDYAAYNVYDQTLDRFTKTVILERETRVILSALSSPAPTN